MTTDPLFEPLAAIFRLAVIRSLVSQLDQSKAIPDDLDRTGKEFKDTIYNTAFFVLAQLEEGAGFEQDDERFYSNLVFTPFGESPAEATKLIAQGRRIILHGGLTDEEVENVIVDYLKN